MKVTIELSPEEVANILAYEMEGESLPSPGEVNAAWVKGKIADHFRRTSVHCISTFGGKDPGKGRVAESWARKVVKRICRRRKPAYAFGT